MIQTAEVVLKRNDQWLHFSQPRKVITAAQVDEILPALGAVEAAVLEQGLYAAGFLSYEAAPAFDRAFRVLPAGGFPLLWFGLYSRADPIALPRPIHEVRPLNWQPTIAREEYHTAIEAIKAHIAAGRTYQVNYTMRLAATFEADPWHFFLDLAQSQNRYAAYVDTGRYVICSASPELFFELDGQSITGRPMKGTARRGRTTSEDREQAEWLRNSTKNRAENVMIVDMIRNDLGRIAEIGSVNVPELFTIERYPTLFQMTSTVAAKTRASISEIFTALFPCASITGAPKVSTMRIISELETTPRRIYTGSIGFIAPERKAQFSVAIRTAVIDRETGQIEYGAGGGIVWDSTGEDEYSEALLKARIITVKPKEFALIETIRWTPGQGYFLYERHIARMADSADYFGFSFSRERLESCLLEMAMKFSTPQRVRVLMDRTGKLTAEAQEFHQNTSRRMKVGLADRPIHSQDTFLFHKTTQREAYEAALRSVPGCGDALLFNEKGELTEFTIGNLVVDLDGELLTPPVECGLLAGTYRAHMLESRKIQERVVQKSDLTRCKSVYLINSVREWVRVAVESR